MNRLHSTDNPFNGKEPWKYNQIVETVIDVYKRQVPNILLWLIYRRTVEWKELWNLLKRISGRVFAGGKR